MYVWTFGRDNSFDSIFVIFCFGFIFANERRFESFLSRKRFVPLSDTFDELEGIGVFEIGSRICLILIFRLFSYKN